MSPPKMLEFTGTLLSARHVQQYMTTDLHMLPGVNVHLRTDAGLDVQAIQLFDDYPSAQVFAAGLHKGARITARLPIKLCEVRGIATSITTHTPLPTHPAAPSFHEPAEHEETIHQLLNQ